MERSTFSYLGVVALGLGLVVGASGGAGLAAAGVTHTTSGGDAELATDSNHNVTIQGQILQPDGTPAADEFILVFGSGTFRDLRTDGNGEFALEVPANTQRTLAFEQVGFDRDGTPDLYTLTSVNSSSSVDLGTVQLPTAHVLNVTVVDSTGDPVENAAVFIEHSREGASTRAGTQTNDDGQFDIAPGLVPPGYEVAGNVSVTVSPEGSDEVAVQRNLTVTEDQEITVTLDGEGDDESPLDGAAADYDADGDGEIDIGELSDAAADYAQGGLGIDGLTGVAAAYAAT